MLASCLHDAALLWRRHKFSPTLQCEFSSFLSLSVDFDSMVQETVTDVQRDPHYGYTHRFAWEQEVFRNWSMSMPDRVQLHQ